MSVFGSWMVHQHMHTFWMVILSAVSILFLLLDICFEDVDCKEELEENKTALGFYILAVQLMYLFVAVVAFMICCVPVITNHLNNL